MSKMQAIGSKIKVLLTKIILGICYYYVDAKYKFNFFSVKEFLDKAREDLDNVV